MNELITISIGSARSVRGDRLIALRFWLVLLLSLCLVEAARSEPTPEISFQDVAPILAIRCAKCHAEKGLMGSAPEGYQLTSYAATMSVTDRVRVVAGNPDASELVRRIRGQAKPRMPFDGPPYLAEDEIRLIESWIAQGAKDSAGKAADMPAGATVRLHGTLDKEQSLDGLELGIDSRTRIDDSPRAGDYVEVRGLLDNNGRVIVERLRRR